MGAPSAPASNAIIFTTYSLFLLMGTGLAWKFRHALRGGFLSNNRTQTAIPVALNFIASEIQERQQHRTYQKQCEQRAAFTIIISLPKDAAREVKRHASSLVTTERRHTSRQLRTRQGFHPDPDSTEDLPPEVEEDAAHYGRRLEAPGQPSTLPPREEGDGVSVVDMKLRLYRLGSGILFAYPELATITGVQGVVVYALSSALPILIFAYVGCIVRKKCPDGFVLTEWTRERYGTVAMLYLSFATLVTLFLYLTAELSAVGQVVTSLTTINQLPVMIVQVVVTTIYTSLGGFRISFITDNVQGAMTIGLVIIAAATIGARTEINTSLIQESGLLKPSLLGWQLLYILPVCILTNNFFLSNYWLRTFASKTDKDLWIGTSIATGVNLIVLTLVGCTGLVSVWSGALPMDDVADSGSVAFFLLLERLPGWVIGIILVMVITLSCASFDTLQSAVISSASNDLFRNKLNIWWIRLGVVLLIAPAMAIALGAPSILQIYLISDLVSACVVPVLCIGLFDACYWWRGFEVMSGGIGGIICSFVFGVIYFDGDVERAGKLLILSEGLYANDWSVFGVFVAAPVGSIICAFTALALRLSYQYISAKRAGRRFDAFDRPAEPGFGFGAGNVAETQQRVGDDEDADSAAEQVPVKPAGKFF